MKNKVEGILLGIGFLMFFSGGLYQANQVLQVLFGNVAPGFETGIYWTPFYYFIVYGVAARVYYDKANVFSVVGMVFIVFSMIVLVGLTFPSEFDGSKQQASYVSLLALANGLIWLFLASRMKSILKYLIAFFVLVFSMPLPAFLILHHIRGSLTDQKLAMFQFAFSNVGSMTLLVVIALACLASGLSKFFGLSLNESA